MYNIVDFSFVVQVHRLNRSAIEAILLTISSIRV
jgi:hypothetical protein